MVGWWVAVGGRGHGQTKIDRQDRQRHRHTCLHRWGAIFFLSAQTFRHALHAGNPSSFGARTCRHPMYSFLPCQSKPVIKHTYMLVVYPSGRDCITPLQLDGEMPEDERARPRTIEVCRRMSACVLARELPRKT